MSRGWVLLLLLFLFGCQTLTEKEQAATLEDTLKRYEATIRWGGIGQAHSFATDQVGLTEQKKSDDLRITRYEVVQGPSMLGKNRAVQAVVIEYVNESNQQVREVIDQQVWIYDEDASTWSRQSPAPALK